jgi:hypothetical protein
MGTLAKAMALKKQAEANRSKRQKILPFPPPHPKQLMMLMSAADVIVFGGGAGPGKSTALIWAAAKLTKYGKYSGVILRRTYPEIMNEGGLWDESMRWYPMRGAKAHQTRLEWMFPSGATVRFSHLQHEKDLEDWQGAQLPFIGFDEVTHFTKKQFFYLLSRLRSPHGFKPKMIATCNPDADSWVAELVDWWIGKDGYPDPNKIGVIRYFIVKDDIVRWGDTAEELKEKYPNSGNWECLPKSFTFIGATIADNPSLLAADPGYVANLQAQDSINRDRLLHGNWHVKKAEAMLFNSEKVDECAVGSFALPVHGRRYLWGIDPNYGGDDFFVAQAWDVSSVPHKLVYEYRKSNTPVTTTIRALAPYFKRYPELIVGIESNSGGTVVAENIQEKLPGLNIQKVLSTKSSKVINTDRLALMVEEGSIEFPPNWAGISEMKKFSKEERRAISEHDDTIMAMAAAFACIDLVHNKDIVDGKVGRPFQHPTY